MKIKSSNKAQVEDVVKIHGTIHGIVMSTAFSIGPCFFLSTLQEVSVLPNNEIAIALGDLIRTEHIKAEDGLYRIPV